MRQAEIASGGGGGVGGRRMHVQAARRPEKAERERERCAGEDPVAAVALRHRDCRRDRAEEKEGWKRGLWAVFRGERRDG